MRVRYKILEILKQRGGFVSGSFLGESLEISRSAVWKHIEALKGEGYSIESVNNRGYRLLESGDILNPAEIEKGLTTRFIGREIFYLKTVDSTNNVLKKLAEDGCKDGALCICEEQVKGKGRRGRSWSLEPGCAIAMSIALRPTFSPELAPNLTLLMGLAVNKTLKTLCGAESMIKWPNDIVIGTKKVGGILLEMTTEETDIKYIICGVGINLKNNSFPPELEGIATSVFLETGKEFLRKDVVSSVLNCFEEYYTAYCGCGSLTPFLEEYKACCLNIGRELVAVFANEEVKGIGVDINSAGELLIKQNDGKVRTLRSGEVSVKGIYR